MTARLSGHNLIHSTGGTVAMSDANGISIRVEELRAGICQFDVYDQDKILLLRSGTTLSDVQIAAIRERGITHVILHPSDAKTVAGSNPSAKTDRSHDPRKVPLNVGPEKRIDRTNEPYSPERSLRFSQAISGMVDTLENLGKQIDQLTNSDVNKIKRIPYDLAELVREDADQVIATTLGPQAASGLSTRCSQMCVLSINTGLELELSDEELTNLGLAALLHDLGLHFLPAAIADPSVSLTAEEAWEYRRHPSLIADALKYQPEIPVPVRLLVRQVHERPDGSGYPDRLRKSRIHPLARILNAVDSYLTLTQAGPGRPPIVPHDAVCFMLLQGKEGIFDSDVLRAFIGQLCLFPIGSSVQLDNGERATVVRRDGPHYANPIVHIDNTPDEATISLRNSGRSIIKPIPNIARKEMRVPPELAEAMTISMLEPA